MPNWRPVPRQTGHLGRDGAWLRCAFTPVGTSLLNWLPFPQRISLQVELMGVVDEAVNDGIGQGGIANGGVPVFNPKVASDDSRVGAVTVVEHFQQVAPMRVVEHG
jgi:hypothetical protein